MALALSAILLLFIFFLIGTLVLNTLVAANVNRSLISFELSAVVGLMAYAVLCLILNSILPLNPYMNLFFLVSLSAISLVWHRKKLLSDIKQGWLRLLFVSIYVLFVAAISTTNTDTFGYYLPFINWYNQEPVVLGITAINDHLGFNSIWHLLSSGLRTPLGGLTFSFSINVVVTISVLGILIARIQKALNDRIDTLVFWNFATMLGIVFASHLVVMGHLKSPSADWPTALFIMASVSFFLEAKFRNETLCRYLSMSFACFSLFIKITSLLSIFIVLVNVWDWTRNSSQERRGLIVFLFAAFGVACVWFARNLLSTGCLVYPISQTCMESLPWGTPLSVVHKVQNGIVWWARDPEADRTLVLSGWDWVASWWHRNSQFRFVEAYYRTLKVFLPLLSVLLIATTLVKSRTLYKEERVQLVLLLLSGMSLVFFFVTAPDPRFAFGPLLVFFASLLALLLLLFRRWYAHPMQNKLLFAICLCVFAREQFILLKYNQFSFSHEPWPLTQYLNVEHDLPERSQKYNCRMGLFSYVKDCVPK